jgi:SAM-dependent methyltransferase
MDHRSRHAIANVLRKTRLLGLADAGLLGWNLIRKLPRNVRFHARQPGFPFPPARLAFDAYGHVDHRIYFETGERDARMIADIVNRDVPGERVRVCEWGCGPGRVIRHLHKALRHRTVEIFGTDYNDTTIESCRANLPQITFRRNELSPPLPFGDGILDCVYALSVFTHLSEAKHFEWMRELHRVLRPGGILILTTHSDAAADRLLPAESEAYAAGKLVVRGDIKEGKKWYLAYQPPAFVRNELLKDWEVLSHAPAQFFRATQDVWVARK